MLGFFARALGTIRSSQIVFATYLRQHGKGNAPVIERVQALLNEWVPREVYGASTHSEFCYQWHPDCLVRLVSRVMEEASDGG